MSQESSIQIKTQPKGGRNGTNPHQAHSATLTTMFTSLWSNRRLIMQITQREIVSRYRGSVMGMAWSFFNPMIMLFVYTFVFSVVFKMRWGTGGAENKADFAIFLFVGMIVHALITECITQAPGLILTNVNYVKKVVFPLEILPWAAMGSALFNSTVSTVVLLLAQLFINHNLPWTIVFFPLVLIPLVFACMGFIWFLAALGVYLRDIGQVTGIFTTMLMFLSPVFYPISALPKEYQLWMQLNPLTLIIEESREVLIFGNLPDWKALGIGLIVGLIISISGFWWFQKTRRGFADVI